MSAKRFRVYDNGGISVDRYTVVFGDDDLADQCGGEYPYIAASGEPFHPQGFGQHGGNMGKPIDGIYENELLLHWLETTHNGRLNVIDLAHAIKTNCYLTGERETLAKIETSKEYRAYFENIGYGSSLWVPALGKVGHLGKRIRFRDLPPNTRKFAAMCYRDYYLTPVVENEDNDPGDGTDYCPKCDIYGYPCWCGHNKKGDDSDE